MSSEAGDIADLRVQLHEERAHDEIQARFAELNGLLEAACSELAELRAAHADHLTSYHAPAPEEPEVPPAPEEPEVPPAPPEEPEVPPLTEVPPLPTHALLRRLGRAD